MSITKPNRLTTLEIPAGGKHFFDAVMFVMQSADEIYGIPDHEDYVATMDVIAAEAKARSAAAKHNALEAIDEQIGQVLYQAMIDSDPTGRLNRMLPQWRDLPKDERAIWNDRALHDPSVDKGAAHD